MLRRPAQIWFLFVCALLIALAGMVWLSMKAIEVDEARNDLLVETERGRLEAELQDKVTAVLWRMDSMLTPLIGQEATRPFAMYQPFIPGPETTKAVKGAEPPPEFVPSPLLRTPSEFVRLHFQIDPQGNFSSPQAPNGSARPMALACGISESELKFCEVKLGEFASCVSKPQLLAELPEESIRQYVGEAVEWEGGYNSLSNRAFSNNWATDYGNLELNRLQTQADSDASPQQSWNRNSSSSAILNAPAQTAANDSPEAQQELANRSQTPSQQAEFPASQQASPRQQSATQLSQSLQSAPTQQRMQQSEELANDAGKKDPYAYQATKAPGRGGRDWIQRYMAFDSFANTSFSQQQYAVGTIGSSNGIVREGVTRWIWHEDQLILARRVTVDNELLVQGCWLDWPKLKQQLLEDVADLLGDLDLKPVTNQDSVETSLALATLPAQLSILDSDLARFEKQLNESNGSRWSPIHVALSLAWIGFGFASVAVGSLLAGVMQLSERRGAFVAAVTHELRTPLTTFRMYAEMLSEGMVRPVEKQQVYLETLKAESNRLTHLVENVLSYSRLERGAAGSRSETTTWDRLLDRIEPRLRERAEQASMKLYVDVADSIRKAQICTDPGAVEQILFNLVENACKYGLNLDDNRLQIRITESGKQWSLQVQDHGEGVSPLDRKRLFQPFSKSVERAAETAPGVGLGLALCRRLAKVLGGSIQLIDHADSELKGACFELRLPKSLC